jgi:hypothetical protein
MKTYNVSVSPRTAFNSLLSLLAIAIFGASLAGCGSSMQMPPGVAPSITAEPAAQSTPVGQMATFTVVAAGTAPLGYQWSENGMAINGATSSTFTTPAVVPTNTGESFAVAVTNKTGFATSTAALLTVLPRAPQTGDWRFQGMDLPTGGLNTPEQLLSFHDVALPNFLGTSLEVGLQFGDFCGSPGPDFCEWTFFGFNAPTGIAEPTDIYANDILDNLDIDLSSLADGTTVIRSLDLEPANQVFALGAIQVSQAGGFEFSSQTVPPSQLQATATQLGEQSIVITALGFDAAGNVFVVSYGWQGDTKTMYETQAVIIPSVSTDVATADSTAIIAAIANLASQGFIITGLGGNAANGLVIVGTRVQGDTLARPLEYLTEVSGIQGQTNSTLQSLWGVVTGVQPGLTVDFGEQ